MVAMGTLGEDLVNFKHDRFSPATTPVTTEETAEKLPFNPFQPPPDISNALTIAEPTVVAPTVPFADDDAIAAPTVVAPTAAHPFSDAIAAPTVVAPTAAHPFADDDATLRHLTAGTMLSEDELPNYYGVEIVVN